MGYLALQAFLVERRRAGETQTHWSTVHIGQALDDRGELNELNPLSLKKTIYIKWALC